MEDHNDREDSDADGLYDTIGRRTYLKGAAAAAAAAGGVASTASATHYDTITVPSNTRHDINVGSGETLENVLIDMTASGASARILTSGSGWEIRNVGFKGNHPGGHYLLIPGVSSSSGHGLVENVYLGDGQTEHSDSGGIWVNANLPHRGTITFRNVHVAHMIDNGLYGSGPGAQGYDGNAHVEDSYFLSNNISNIRLSSRGPESSVDNCTVVVDGTTRECGEGCSTWGAISNRGVWAWYGNVDVDNSDIQGGFYTKDGGSITTSNTRTGSDADTTPPAGVPMTAEEAAEGSGGDSIVGDDDAHEFEIEGPGEFYFEVDQEVEPDPSIEEWTEYGETHGDDWVSFTLSDTGSTHWWFKHDVVQLDTTDDQTAYIDGEEYGGPTVVEDFERSSPLGDYGGATSLYSVETSTVYEGSQALTNDGGSFGSAVSTSGLSDYPSRGDEVHVRFTNAGDDNFVATHLFAQSETDNPDSYSVGISSAGAWRMWRHDGGDVTQIASQSVSASEQISGWYRAEIRTDSSTVYADLYDDANDALIASISADDTTYSSGGIGFRSAGNGEVWDYVHR